jgi:acetyl-CoA carboxylase beta subunit
MLTRYLSHCTHQIGANASNCEWLKRRGGLGGTRLQEALLSLAYLPMLIGTLGEVTARLG